MFGFGKPPFRSPRKRSPQGSQDGKSYKDNTRVRVYVRARPLYEEDEDPLARRPLEFPSKKEVRLVEQKQETIYKFDRVFAPEASNADVCKAVSEPLINTVIDGYNGSFMVYGQTGTGKTYTVLSDDGLIPQTISQLFQRTNGDTEFSYKIFLSYLQIYKDKIHDLLDPSKDMELHLREHPQEGVIVDGLKEFEIPDPDEAERLLEYGRKNLVMAETKMVRLSSRSHSLCVIRVEKFKSTVVEEESKEESNEESMEVARVLLERDEKLWKGKLYLCDLAGSERLKKTGAAGDRFEEARYINSSLLELGNVIHALADSRHAHVPFRNSTLTRLLKESLGGNSKASLMICVSSSVKDLNETKCSLNFGQRAMRVTKFSTPNVEIDYKALAEYLTKKLRELESAYHVEKENYKQLKKELTQTRRKPSRIPVLKNRLPPPDDSPQADLRPLIQLAKSQLEQVKEEEKSYLSRLRLIEQSTTTDDFFYQSTSEASTETTQASFDVSNESAQTFSSDFSSFWSADDIPLSSDYYPFDIRELGTINRTSSPQPCDIDVSVDQHSASLWNNENLLTYKDDLTESQVTLLRSSSLTQDDRKGDLPFQVDIVDGPLETSEGNVTSGRVQKDTMGNTANKDKENGSVLANEDYTVVELRRKSEELTDVTTKRKSGNRLSAFLEIVKLRDGGEGAKFREVDVRWNSEADSGSLSSAVSTPRNSRLQRNSNYEISSKEDSVGNLNNVQEEQSSNNTPENVAIKESPKVVLRNKKGKSLSRLFRRHSFDESKFRIKKKEKRLSATIDENVLALNGKFDDVQKRTKSAMFDDHEKNKEIVLAALKDLEQEDLLESKIYANSTGQPTIVNGFHVEKDSVRKPVGNVNTLNGREVSKLSSEPIINDPNNLQLRIGENTTKTSCQVERLSDKSIDPLSDLTSSSTTSLSDTHSVPKANGADINRDSPMDLEENIPNSEATKPLRSIVMDSDAGTVEVVVDKKRSVEGNRLYVRNRGRESFVFETDMSLMDLDFDHEPTIPEPADSPKDLPVVESCSDLAATHDFNLIESAGESNIRSTDRMVFLPKQVHGQFEVEDESNFETDRMDPFTVLNTTLEMIEPPVALKSESTEFLLSGSQNGLGPTSMEDLQEIDQSLGQSMDVNVRDTTRQPIAPGKYGLHNGEVSEERGGELVSQEKQGLLTQPHYYADTKVPETFSVGIVESLPSCSIVNTINSNDTIEPIQNEIRKPLFSPTVDYVDNSFSSDIETSYGDAPIVDTFSPLGNGDNSTATQFSHSMDSHAISLAQGVKVPDAAPSNNDQQVSSVSSTGEVRPVMPQNSPQDLPANTCFTSDGVKTVIRRPKTDKGDIYRNSKDVHSSIWDSFDMEMDKVDRVNVRDSLIEPNDIFIAATEPVEKTVPSRDKEDQHEVVKRRSKDLSETTDATSKEAKESKRRSLVMKALLIDEVMENANTYDADHLEAITKRISLIGDEDANFPEETALQVHQTEIHTRDELTSDYDKVKQSSPKEHSSPMAEKLESYVNGHLLPDSDDLCDDLDDSFRDTDSPFDFSEVSDENRNYIQRPGSVHSSFSTDTELELVHAMEESDKLRASLSNVKRQYDDILSQFDSLLGSKSTTERELENTKEYLAETMKCKLELEEELQRARVQLALVSAARKEELGYESSRSEASEPLSLSPIRQKGEENGDLSGSDDSDSNNEFVSQTTLTNVTPIDGASPIDGTSLSPEVDNREEALNRICSSSEATLQDITDSYRSQNVSAEMNGVRGTSIEFIGEDEREPEYSCVQQQEEKGVIDDDVPTPKLSLSEISLPMPMTAEISVPITENIMEISSVRDTESCLAMEPEYSCDFSSIKEVPQVVTKQPFSIQEPSLSTERQEPKPNLDLYSDILLPCTQTVILDTCASAEVPHVPFPTSAVQREAPMEHLPLTTEANRNLASDNLIGKENGHQISDENATSVRKKNGRRSRPASKIIDEADPKEFRWISKKGSVTSEEKMKRNEQLTLAAIQNAELKKELLLTKLEKIRLEAVLSCVMMRTPSSEVSREYKKLSINSITSSKSTLRSSASATDLTFSGGSERTSPFHVSPRRLSSTQWPKIRTTGESTAGSPSLSSYDPGLRLSHRESDVISPTSSLFEHSSLLTDSSFSPITVGESSPSVLSVVTTGMPTSERTAPIGQDGEDQSTTKATRRRSKDHDGNRSLLSDDTTDVTSGDDSRHDPDEAETKKEKSTVGCLPFLKRRSGKKKSKKSKTDKSPAHSNDSYHL